MPKVQSVVVLSRKLFFCPLCFYSTDTPDVFAISIKPRKHYQIDEFLDQKHGGSAHYLDTFRSFSQLYNITTEEIDFVQLENLLDPATVLDGSFCKLYDRYFECKTLLNKV